MKKPTRVKFYTKGGEKIAFKPRQKVTKPIKVPFLVPKNYKFVKAFLEHSIKLKKI